MTDYDKLCMAKRQLEDLRADLAGKIATDPAAESTLIDLHARVSKALKALTAQA
ncbi:hypothetical protein [Aliishimia ponticola]|uniref:hypothetical protein n=1 Tax=Aliishimia ponticola TaxID=2499833 RepID=UPI001455E4D2|nr:hypothetical protein [Aliishimia ponticola]